MCALEAVESRKPILIKTTCLEGDALRNITGITMSRNSNYFYTVYLDDAMSQKTETQTLAMDNLQGNTTKNTKY